MDIIAIEVLKVIRKGEHGDLRPFNYNKNVYRAQIFSVVTDSNYQSPDIEI